MKLLTYLFSGLLMLLGVISFLPPPGDVHDAGVSGLEMVLGGILIAWGGALAWSRTANYRGGLATAAGAFLLGCGVYISLALFLMDASQLQAGAGSKLTASLLFLLPAAALLAWGHRIHTRRVRAAKEQRSSREPGNSVHESAAIVAGKGPASPPGAAGSFLDTLVEMSFTKGPSGEDLYHPYGLFLKGRVLPTSDLKDRIKKQEKDFIRYGFPVALIYGLWAGVRGPSLIDLFVLMVVLALVQWRQLRLVRGLPVCAQRPGRHEVMGRLGRLYPRWVVQIMILNGLLLIALAAATPWLMERPLAEVTNLVAIEAGLGVACVLLGALLLRAGRAGR